jgi:hypothetical protein
MEREEKGWIIRERERGNGWVARRRERGKIDG